MEKINLKLFEFYNLEVELNGFVNAQTGERTILGLLNEKLKLTTKYWINELSKKVAEEKKSIETLKEELIKKHGKVDENGNFSIPKYVNEVKDENGEIIEAEFNPVYIDFQNDFNALLQEEKELEYKPIKLSELEDIKSESNYSTFFKLVTANEQA
jgi:hypothetical protein